MTRSSSTSRPERVAEIDALRFGAALAVVFYHYHWAEFGFLGVHLFFLIPGFVIFWSASKSSPLKFCISRATRLYPSFWVCLTMTILVRAGTDEGLSTSASLANYTMFPQVLGRPLADNVYWTLLIEAKFYLFVLALLVSGLWERRQGALEFWTIVSIWALSPAAPRVVHYLALDSYSAYFIVGAYLYLIRNGERGLRLYIPLALATGVGVWQAIVNETGFTHDGSPYAQYSVLGWLIAVYGMFLLLAFRVWRLPSWRYWGAMGAMTYPLYLVHVKVAMGLAENWIPDAGREMQHLLSLGIALCLAALLAIAIELKGCRLLQRWLTSATDALTVRMEV